MNYIIFYLFLFIIILCLIYYIYNYPKYCERFNTSTLTQEQIIVIQKLSPYLITIKKLYEHTEKLIKKFETQNNLTINGNITSSGKLIVTGNTVIDSDLNVIEKLIVGDLNSPNINTKVLNVPTLIIGNTIITESLLIELMSFNYGKIICEEIKCDNIICKDIKATESFNVDTNLDCTSIVCNDKCYVNDTLNVDNFKFYVEKHTGTNMLILKKNIGPYVNEDDAMFIGFIIENGKDNTRMIFQGAKTAGPKFF